MAIELGKIRRGIPIASLTALCPAKLPVHTASVWPTNKPLFSPAQNRLSTLSTLRALVLGATDRYLIEFPLLPA